MTMASLVSDDLWSYAESLLVGRMTSILHNTLALKFAIVHYSAIRVLYRNNNWLFTTNHQ